MWRLPCALVLLSLAGSATAQIPDEFTNLQVLPEDTGKRALVTIMRDFSAALGVRCNHCHVGEDPDSLQGYEFASDDREPKRVARAMMKMTQQINETLLPTTGRRRVTAVRCVTCHRGLYEPQTLDRILEQILEHDTVDTAIDEYRFLREEYHGRGAYDFGPATLHSVARKLATKGDLDGAIALVQLGLEQDPEAADSYLTLAQYQAEKGETAQARKSLLRCLELAPENRWARQLLDRLSLEDDK